MNDFQRRIGVGQHQPRDGRTGSATNTTPIVADDGPLRGLEVGERTEHRTGRVDTKVTAASIHVNPNLTARKVPR